MTSMLQRGTDSPNEQRCPKFGAQIQRSVSIHSRPNRQSRASVNIYFQRNSRTSVAAFSDRPLFPCYVNIPSPSIYHLFLFERYGPCPDSDTTALPQLRTLSRKQRKRSKGHISAFQKYKRSSLIGCSPGQASRAVRNLRGGR